MTTKRQNTIQPVPDCEAEIGRVLGMIQDCRNRTRESLENLDPAAVDFAGGFNNHSIGTLLYHIAAVELDWLWAEVTEGGKGLSPDIWKKFQIEMRDDQKRLSPVRGVSLKEHWGLLDLVRDMLLEVYKQISLDDYRRPRELEQYDVTPEWVLHHLMQHEAGHRDELEMLRQMAAQQSK